MYSRAGEIPLRLLLKDHNPLRKGREDLPKETRVKFGSVGAQACSLGREPQVPSGKTTREPRRGDGNFPRSEDLPSPLRGSREFGALPSLGLAPQATCLGSYGAHSKKTTG
jgi:hypothetical protein